MPAVDEGEDILPKHCVSCFELLGSGRHQRAGQYLSKYEIARFKDDVQVFTVLKRLVRNFYFFLLIENFNLRIPAGGLSTTKTRLK